MTIALRLEFQVTGKLIIVLHQLIIVTMRTYGRHLLVINILTLRDTTKASLIDQGPIVVRQVRPEALVPSDIHRLLKFTVSQVHEILIDFNQSLTCT